MDWITWLPIALLLVFGIGWGITAYKLYKSGVPQDQLLKQSSLKMEDQVDTLVDKVLEALAKADAKRGLRASYFDQADFYQDLGRLPAAYTQAVRLDGKTQRNGDAPGIDYATDQTTGNVVLK